MKRNFLLLCLVLLPMGILAQEQEAKKQYHTGWQVNFGTNQFVRLKLNNTYSRSYVNMNYRWDWVSLEEEISYLHDWFNNNSGFLLTLRTNFHIGWFFMFAEINFNSNGYFPITQGAGFDIPLAQLGPVSITLRPVFYLFPFVLGLNYFGHTMDFLGKLDAFFLPSLGLNFTVSL